MSMLIGNNVFFINDEQMVAVVQSWLNRAIPSGAPQILKVSYQTGLMVGSTMMAGFVIETIAPASRLVVMPEPIYPGYAAGAEKQAR